MNSLYFLPEDLENIIVDYKEQIETFDNIQKSEIIIKDDIRQRARKVNYSKLYNTLVDGKNNTCYEMIEGHSIVKPYIDYEYIGKDIDEIKIELLTKLCNIFNVEKEEWAISSNSRTVNGLTKNTLHLILYTKKINMSNLRKIVMKNIDSLNELGGEIETSIYRGISIFRTPMTVKCDYTRCINKETYIEPENFKTYEDFHYHIVSITEGCKEIN